MSVLIIIQARTGSKRLPNKMIIPFYKDKSILNILINRLKEITFSKNIVIATTVNEGDNYIQNICELENIFCFRGSEDNVLQRFIDAADEFKFTKIVRICGDNIFLDLSYLDLLLKELEETEFDYISFKTSNGLPSILTHYGLWAFEGVKLSALKHISYLTDNKLFHEHVTNYIYTNPNEFLIKFLPINSNIETNQKLRLTIDTHEDFLVMQKIYKYLADNNIKITSENIISYLDSNPYLYEIMEQAILLNRK